MVWRRRKWDDRIVLGAYFALAGTTRFMIEFVRVNERVLGPLTLAHVASLAVAAGGALLLSTRRSAGSQTS
jgi:prolipoprotein diacylglyceryltransferase